MKRCAFAGTSSVWPVHWTAGDRRPHSLFGSAREPAFRHEIGEKGARDFTTWKAEPKPRTVSMSAPCWLGPATPPAVAHMTGSVRLAGTGPGARPPARSSLLETTSNRS